MQSMSGFMPHGSCFLWRPDILTLHVASDSLIALAYFGTPLLMLRYVRSRPALWPLAASFGTFILACGLTHVMDVWTIWHPDYWIAGGIKAICAAASLGTALALLPLILAWPFSGWIGGSGTELPRYRMRDTSGRVTSIRMLLCKAGLRVIADH